MNNLATIERLVEENFKLALFFAGANRGLDYHEALSAAMDGLWKAAQGFNPSLCSFGGYARKAIRWAISTEVRNNRLRQIVFGISLDEEVDGELNLAETIEDENVKMPYEKIERCELLQALKQAFRLLPKNQAKILTEYFHRDKDCSQIAVERGVTRQAIHLTYQIALRNLRNILNAVAE